MAVTDAQAIDVAASFTWKEKMTDKSLQQLAVNVNLLLAEIDKYPTLNEWWNNRIIMPIVKTVVPQCIALGIIFGGMLYVHDWLASAFCMAFIVSKIYQGFISVSVHFVYGYLTVQVRESYHKGVADGKASLQTTN
jgi:hypothetical protein